MPEGLLGIERLERSAIETILARAKDFQPVQNQPTKRLDTLRGKMILRITIEPNGAVSACKVESTDLASRTLVAEIVERVKRFNFGPKAGVPRTTILYPIDFLPASS